MNIVSVDPRIDPIWQTLLQQASSSVFHSPAWIQVLTDTYGWEARAYVVLDSRGEPRAGIPFCRVADMMGERVLVLPFSDYCDPLGDDPQCWHFLIDSLLSERCPVNLRCLHNNLPLADERFHRHKASEVARPLSGAWARRIVGRNAGVPHKEQSESLNGMASSFASQIPNKNSEPFLKCT